MVFSIFSVTFPYPQVSHDLSRNALRNEVITSSPVPLPMIFKSRSNAANPPTYHSSNPRISCSRKAREPFQKCHVDVIESIVLRVEECT